MICIGNKTLLIRGEYKIRCYEGTILTVNENNNVYRYLVEDKGRILFVGNELPKEFKKVKTMHLRKRGCFHPLWIPISTLLPTCFDDKERGSLEVGKIADMVIVSENPYEIEKEEIKNLSVERLLINGRPYRSCNENILKQMIRGLISNK